MKRESVWKICFFFIGYPSLNNQGSLLVCQQSRMIQYQQSSVCYIAKFPSPAPPVYLQLPAAIASHSFKYRLSHRSDSTQYYLIGGTAFYWKNTPDSCASGIAGTSHYRRRQIWQCKDKSVLCQKGRPRATASCTQAGFSGVLHAKRCAAFHTDLGQSAGMSAAHLIWKITEWRRTGEERWLHGTRGDFAVLS